MSYANLVLILLVLVWAFSLGWVLWRAARWRSQAPRLGLDEELILTNMFRMHPSRVQFVSIGYESDPVVDSSSGQIVSVGLNALMILLELEMIELSRVDYKTPMRFEASLTMRGIRYMSRQKWVSKMSMASKTSILQPNPVADSKTSE